MRWQCAWQVIDQQNALTVASLMGLGGGASPVSSADFVAPANETEAIIASVWQDMFGIERVGRNDNFFDFSVAEDEATTEKFEALLLEIEGLSEEELDAALLEDVEDI